MRDKKARKSLIKLFGWVLRRHRKFSIPISSLVGLKRPSWNSQARLMLPAGPLPSIASQAMPNPWGGFCFTWGFSFGCFTGLRPWEMMLTGPGRGWPTFLLTSFCCWRWQLMAPTVWWLTRFFDSENTDPAALNQEIGHFLDELHFFFVWAKLRKSRAARSMCLVFWNLGLCMLWAVVKVGYFLCNKGPSNELWKKIQHWLKLCETSVRTEFPYFEVFNSMMVFNLSDNVVRHGVITTMQTSQCLRRIAMAIDLDPHGLKWEWEAVRPIALSQKQTSEMENRDGWKAALNYTLKTSVLKKNTSWLIFRKPSKLTRIRLHRRALASFEFWIYIYFIMKYVTLVSGREWSKASAKPTVAFTPGVLGRSLQLLSDDASAFWPWLKNRSKTFCRELADCLPELSKNTQGLRKRKEWTRACRKKRRLVLKQLFYPRNEKVLQKPCVLCLPLPNGAKPETTIRLCRKKLPKS